MEVSDLKQTLDILWIVVAAALVMFMQAGFTALESGLTRAKNSINVAMKNLTDFVVSVLIFWLFGYGLMFGDSLHGLWGGSLFALSGMSELHDFAVFAFQATFAGTAATIVSGAVAERMRFAAYAVVVIALVGCIYPISGHWIWASGGWLAEKQMVDFAGSTVVHSLGGWVGLAGALVLGARAGRFDEHGGPRQIHGQNLVLGVLGVLILWFGWIGFNAGSTLSADRTVALILTNTMLAAAAGGLSCFLTSLVMNAGRVSIEKMLNGVVGGLVSITAGCAVVEPGGAVAMGLIGGVIVYLSEEFVLRALRVDDPVNVTAAHGIAGAWGTLALAFFAPAANLPLGSAAAQFAVQLQGVAAVFAWGFGLGLLLFSLLKAFAFLRVTTEAETLGLNVHEHGASSSLLDTMNAMDQMIKAYNADNVRMDGFNGEADEHSGDLTRRIKVEFGTEGYEIATLFNQLIDYFHDTVHDIKKGMRQVVEAAQLLAESSEAMRGDARQQHVFSKELMGSIQDIAAAIQHIARNTTEAATAVDAANHHTDDGKQVLESTIDSIRELADKVLGAFQAIAELQDRMAAIETMVNTISGISDQTNLLALNAAIEAARAGEVGRGFAVVADEVRALSRHTHKATADIKTLIEQLKNSTAIARKTIDESRESAESTVGQAQSSQSAIGAIIERIQNLATMSANIAAAVEKQSASVSSVENQVDNFFLVARISTERANAISATSEQLHNLADSLESLVHGFKVDEQTRAKLH